MVLKKAILAIKKRLTIIAFHGSNVNCTICGWNGKRFVKNRCPKCNSLPRTRLIPFSVSFFDIPTKLSSILHVGPTKIE